MSVLDEVLCTGHGVGDVVPVLHYLEEKRTYTFASPAECGGSARVFAHFGLRPSPWR